MPLSISIIIPAYNEGARLGKTLDTVFRYLNEHAPDSEVIIVDDGSQDDTPKIAEQGIASAGRTAGRLIRNEPNRGKGHAVRTGLLAARSPIALFSDADLSTPITETPKVVAPIYSGNYDLVFGSRALDRSLIGKHQSWRREQSGRVFNLAVWLATGLPFSDTQCGFKAFRMDVCRPIIEGAVIDRFGFDVELLYIAHKARLRLLECPVRWDDDERSTLSFRHGLHAFGEVRAIRRQAQRGIYDKAITAAREFTMQTEERLPIPFSSADLFESNAPPELAGFNPKG
ncbi:MAG: glycosyltransferase family 2 protein [Pyrinomonadaceae bacterium]|nr:glycosyltransferase family 2 protein [Pyrinomonadaceae bacterium]